MLIVAARNLHVGLLLITVDMSNSTAIPNTVVTPDNYSPLVSIIVLVLLCSTVMAIVTRIGMKFAVSRAFGPDDLLMFIALVSKDMEALLSSTYQECARLSVLDNPLLYIFRPPTGWGSRSTHCQMFN